MLNPETEALRLVAQQAILDAQNEQRDAEMALNSHLVHMSNLSQSHVWDSIDFYSRPAAVERAEMDAYGAIENGLMWIEMEDFVNPTIIEDYYKGGKIWELEQKS